MHCMFRQTHSQFFNNRVRIVYPGALVAICFYNFNLENLYADDV